MGKLILIDIDVLGVFLVKKWLSRGVVVCEKWATRVLKKGGF